MRRFCSKALIAGVVLCAWAGLSSNAIADEITDESFNPYLKGVPTHPVAKPGAVIDKNNVDQVKDLLAEDYYQAIKKGWYNMRVGETFLLEHDPSYIEATKNNYKTVKLDPAKGMLDGFVAGRPFPQQPEAGDPNAGIKLAWNYRYFYAEGDSEHVAPFFWVYRNMNTAEQERMLQVSVNIIRFTRRVQVAPVPALADNPGGVYNSFYMQVFEPFDVKNTQLLIHRYEDDNQREDAWLYLGFQRRVRRLATGQTTDSFLGTDLMIEDFRGYTGRLKDYKWTYKGTVTRLLPIARHNEAKLKTFIEQDDHYQWVDVGGQGNCFHDLPWSLRKTYILEAEPLAEGHPIGKRVISMDAETATITNAMVYDRKGQLWRMFPIGFTRANMQDPIKNKNVKAAAWEMAAGIDVQAMHCTTLHFRNVMNDPNETLPSLFTVQNMRVTGQ